jgi:hypothetical protein
VHELKKKTQGSMGARNGLGALAFTKNAERLFLLGGKTLANVVA